MVDIFFWLPKGKQKWSFWLELQEIIAIILNPTTRWCWNAKMSKNPEEVCGMEGIRLQKRPFQELQDFPEDLGIFLSRHLVKEYSTKAYSTTETL